MEKRQKIIVAVDESEESMYALSWCLSDFISRSAIERSTLILLFVKPPAALSYSVYASEYMFSKDIKKAIEKHDNDLVNSVMERADRVYQKIGTDIHVEKMVGIGEAGNVICSAVEKLKADTLVMGSHGYGFLKRALLGSVSDHCAKHVRCPVVIVKRPDE